MDKFNKEIEKRTKSKKPKRRYYFREYELTGWWVYPIAIPFIIVKDYINKYKKKKYNNLKFTPEKANEIIDKYFYKVLDFDEETKEFIFCQNWMYIWAHKAKNRDKDWCYKFDKELYDYLKKEYYIPNVSKKIEESWDEEFIIFFKG